MLDKIIHTILLLLLGLYFVGMIYVMVRWVGIPLIRFLADTF